MDAPDSSRPFHLGVGLTNACDLGCAHCYRAPGTDALGATDVLAALESLPTRAVNFGTGESGLHPDFPALVEALVARGVAVTMTTNGYSARALPDDLLSRLRDVEFSIDYPDRDRHDQARGAGNWDLVEAEMARCHRLGVSTTVTSVLMKGNADSLGTLAELAASRASTLRVNVFQAVTTTTPAPSFDEFWGAWRHLFEVAAIVTCGEPIVRAVLGLPRPDGAGCGLRTIRLTPRGKIVPCVYTSDGALGLDDLTRLGPRVVDTPPFHELRAVPPACRECRWVETCGGGCASRRLLRGGLDRPDEYCPFVRGVSVRLAARLARPGREMPKAASACTTIVEKV